MANRPFPIDLVRNPLTRLSLNILLSLSAWLLYSSPARADDWCESSGFTYWAKHVRQNRVEGEIAKIQCQAVAGRRSQCGKESLAVAVDACEYLGTQLAEIEGRTDTTQYNTDQLVDALKVLEPSGNAANRVRARAAEVRAKKKSDAEAKVKSAELLDQRAKEEAAFNRAIARVDFDCRSYEASLQEMAAISPARRDAFVVAMKGKLNQYNGRSTQSVAQATLNAALRAQDLLEKATAYKAVQEEFPQDLASYLAQGGAKILCYDPESLAELRNNEAVTLDAIRQAQARAEACTKDKACSRARTRNVMLPSICQVYAFKVEAAEELAAEKKNMRATGVTRPIILGRLAGRYKENAENYANWVDDWRKVVGGSFSPKMCPSE